MKDIWDFFQNQILGMKWLNSLIGDGLEKLGMDLTTKLGGSLQFFIYDTIKILILLSFVNYNLLILQLLL